jgi:site-specific recombinase XerD
MIKYQNGRIRLIFPYNKELVLLIKQQPFYQWDGDNCWWTLPQTEKILGKLVMFCKEHEWKYRFVEDIRHLNRTLRPKMEDMVGYRNCPEIYFEKLTVLRYSRSTIKTYTECFKEFINYFPNKQLDEITEADILSYQKYLVEKRCVSTSYQNQAINSIKFYYEKVAGRDRATYYIERPRKEKVLPEVLSEPEIVAILDNIQNLKHKCLIMTTYSAGLRVGELINLKIADIDSRRMLITVRRGKGRKDRVTLLSHRLLKLLRKYFIQYRPKEFLFEGITGGKYSERSVQNVLKDACRKAGIRKHFQS